MATFDEGISETLLVLRRKRAMTRGAIVEASGLSRSAVNLRLDALLRSGLVQGGLGELRTKGRPADIFSFNSSRGSVLTADIEVTGFRVALCDLAGEIRAEEAQPADATAGPESLLGLVLEAFERLLVSSSTPRASILGIGVSIPAPVKSGAGMSFNPPIIPRWNRFDVPAWFASSFECPVILEKDANAMAYGEARVAFQASDPLLMVQIGTGIGAGMVQDGRVFRGADGAAGDLGHTPLELHHADDGPLCKCGNHGCLEAYAGGWALIRDLQQAGAKVTSDVDLHTLLATADPEAVRLVRRAGRLVGSAIASAVNLLNPRVVVVGGHVAAAGGDHLFAGIREMVYRRSLPLATSDLQIVRSSLFPHAGVLGLAHLVSDESFSPQHIGRLVTKAEDR